MRTLRWPAALLIMAAALFPSAGAAQEAGTVTGQVVAEDTGEPLQGAQVFIVGSSRGTLTDPEGRFLLTNVEPGTQTLQVSLIGYSMATREVEVGATPVDVTIELALDPLGLDEVVVIGYGSARRAEVAGAIASLDTEQFEELPQATVNQLLQGRAPGVQVMQNSGNPGDAISVRVRGSSSISAGNEPLYVLDGVPLTQGNFSELNESFGGQDIDALSDLNPDNIESIEVLKDASAAAIYGSRASNGVVLITTKRGIAGDRARIEFNSYYGVQEAWNVPGFVNTDQYMQIYNEAFADIGVPNFIGYEDDGVVNEIEVVPGTNTDWLDEVLAPAPIYSMAGSVAGGTERTRYYVSGSMFTQDGIVESFGYERLNGRVNLDYQVDDRLDLGTSVSLTRGLHRRARSDNTIVGPFANAIGNPPWYTIYEPDGSYTNTLYPNPVGLARENDATERTIHILGNTFANYRLSDGVDLRASVGLDQYNIHGFLYDSPLLPFANATNGAGISTDVYVNKVVYEGTLNWARDLGALHSLSGVVGASYEDNTTESADVTGQQFPSEHFRYLTSAATIIEGDSEREDWALQSYFGRVSYTYGDRYTATFNIRTDGSSRFGEDNRFGVFPSASLLWRVSGERFMQNQDVVSNLALRTSYGRTGNQAGIGNFAARGLFTGGDNYNDVPGIAPEQLANPELRWETTDQFNIGADVAFLDDRLGFSMDYYIKETTDLLVERPVPSTTGFESIWFNVGSIENRGFELAANAQILRGGTDGLSWTVDANIATNENEVTELFSDQPFITGFVSRVEEGEELGAFYGWVTDGLFQSTDEICFDPTGESCAPGTAYHSDDTAPGDIRFQDLDGDGVITADDRDVIGSPWPDFTGGVTNTLAFRGLDLSVFFQFSQGNEIYNAVRIYSDAYGLGFLDGMSDRALDRWTPENTDATEPRAVVGDPNGNTRDSDRFIEDGSYMRLKNAVLGYTFPTDLAQRMGLESLRVYLQGQNLLTSTDYSGFDPEVNYAGDTAVTRGTDFYTLPQARIFSAGFNVGF